MQNVSGAIAITRTTAREAGYCEYPLEHGDNILGVAGKGRKRQ
jgi:hypothetical protein